MASATEVGSIYYDLNLVTAAFDAQMAEARAKAGGFGDQLTGIGKGISSVGSTLMPFSIAAGAAIGVAVKSAMSFDQTMELLHTQAGASQAQVEQLTPKVEELASQVGFSPTSLANALYHVSSVGNGIWSVSQQMDILKLAAEGAQVGQADLNDTTYALTSAMSSTIEGTQNAAEAMGYLNAIVGAGDMHMQDLNAAIGTGFLATAKTFGLSLQSTGAALATLTDNGEHADEAATRIRMTMALMGAPTAAAAKVLGSVGLTSQQAMSSINGMDAILKKAGVSQTTLAADMRQPNGMMVALADLKDHLEKAGLSSTAAAAVMSRAFGGGRSDAALLTMLQNLDRLNVKYQTIGANAGKFGQDWAAQQQQANQKMQDFRAEIQVLAVQLGNAFLPTLETLAKQLGGIAQWFSHLSNGNKKLIADILVGVAVLGPFLKILGSVFQVVGILVKGLGFLKDALELLWLTLEYVAAAIGISMGWLLLIIAAVALFAIGVYELIKHWSKVKEFFVHLWEDVYKWIKQHIKLILEVIATLIFGPIALLIFNWSKVKDFFVKLWEDIYAYMQKVPGMLLNIAKDIGKAILSAIEALPGLMLKILDGIAYAIGYYLRFWKNLFLIWIPDIVKAVISEMEKLPGQIAHIMSDVYNAVSGWLVRAWKDSVAFVTQMVKDIINWLIALPGNVAKIASEVWNAITSWVARAWHDSVSFISRMVSDVINFFAQLPGRILGFISSFWSAANRVASGVWHGIMDTLNQLPGLVEGIFTGIWHKITGAAGKLADGAKHVASSIWNSFKDGLGIHSPSYIERAFDAIALSGQKTVDNMKTTVGQLQGLSATATQVTTGGTQGGSNVTKFANVNFGNATFNFANTNDVDYFMQKLGRNVQLAGQGLTALR